MRKRVQRKQQKNRRLTNDDKVVVGPTVVGGLVGGISVQYGLWYQQIILLSARCMHRCMAGLVVALCAITRLQRHGELAKVVSARKKERGR